MSLYTANAGRRAAIVLSLLGLWLSGCGPTAATGDLGAGPSDDTAAADGKPEGVAEVSEGLGPTKQVLYLNFDGAAVKTGAWAHNNAQTNTSFVAKKPAAYPAFNATPWGARTAVIAEVAAGVARNFENFQVLVTTARPASGAYTMVLVGGLGSDIGVNPGLAGIAPMDPGNTNASDVAFVFSESLHKSGYPVEGIVTAISHEFGHTFGLRHITPTKDIMNPTDCQCSTDWGSGPLAGGGGSQNDVAVMTAVFEPKANLATAVGMAPAKGGAGYWLAGSNGVVANFGDAPADGYAHSPSHPVVGMAARTDGAGYWLVTTAGQVFSFGSAHNYGSVSGALAKPIVGIASTPTNAGYWLVASDGGIFAFGDAHFYGSMGGKPLTKPVVGIARTHTGNGYWLVASDGGIFAFGGAHFYGSMGGKVLAKPIVGMAPTANGAGYWLVASDGGIFSFGDAKFYGSTGGKKLSKPVVGIAPTPTGAGYWMVAGDGGVFSFGDAKFYGSNG